MEDSRGTGVADAVVFEVGALWHRRAALPLASDAALGCAGEAWWPGPTERDRGLGRAPTRRAATGPGAAVAAPSASQYVPARAGGCGGPERPRRNRGGVLPRRAAGGKENESSVAPARGCCLDLPGTVVVADAMHTQRALSAQIVDAGGTELWIAKHNQPTLRADITTVFPADDRTVAKGHGRQETRTLTASSDLRGYSDWPGLDQVFRRERTRRHTKSGKPQQQVVYGLTSLPATQASAAQLLAFNRAYWGIEIGLHYRRDVTFQVDATRQTGGHAGRVMATLTNLVIGLLRAADHTNLAAARRLCDAKLVASLAMLALHTRT